MRLWTMTALEYPVDANESPEVAKALYASRAKDKVLVYDRDPKSPTGYAREPKVFAEGLAIPLGILPYKNGVYVQHGPEIVFLSDTDGDGIGDNTDTDIDGDGAEAVAPFTDNCPLDSNLAHRRSIRLPRSA